MIVMIIFLSLILFFQTTIFFAQNDTCTQGTVLNSCELFDTWKNSQGQPVLVTAQNKYDTPLGTRVCARKFNFSYTRGAVAKNHPSGSDLFAKNATYAQRLNTFLNSIDDQGYFLVYFNRLHLIFLHQLYTYLTKVFTLCNMSHVDSLNEYLRNESKQALNKKTLIVNHLVTLIEAQSNQAILSQFPALPQHLATNIGFTMMKHDYGADLNLLIDKQEEYIIDDPVVQKTIQSMRNDYLSILGNYLSFANEYTKSLAIPDERYGSAFMMHAKFIQNILSEKQPALKTGNLKINATLIRSIKTVNPPLFFYNDESIRAINMVNALAKNLPSNAEQIPWPKKVVEDAKSSQPIKDKNGIAITNQPAAYFKDANDERTTNIKQATQLFVNIPTLQHMYSQELISQPVWLNSSQGVNLMLRACLGDFFVLLDPLFDDYPVLDPCLRCIIANAAIKVGLMKTSSISDRVCTECQTYLEALRNEIAQAAQNEVAVPDLGVSP